MATPSRSPASTSPPPPCKSRAPTRLRAPQPMSDEELVRYRWSTELVHKGGEPAASLESPVIQPLGDAPQQLWIGETSQPHVFAEAPAGGALKAIRQTVWGYGLSHDDIRYPGPVLVATQGVSAQLSFTNHLPEPTRRPKTGCVGADGRKLHHPGMKDGDYPFVQPPSDLAAGAMGADAMGRYYPGHAVVHLHGGEVEWTSDGYPGRVPGAATVMRPGETRTYTYPNQQPGGGMLWFHDHTMDSTARNVYAGLAGGYILRAPNEAQPAIPAGPFELPIIIQDRSFTEPDPDDNQSFLLYGDANFLRGLAAVGTDPKGPSATRQSIRAYCADNQPAPEFKGQAMLVNGKVWPWISILPRPYRLRLLNGCNARILVLRLSNAADAQKQKIGARAYTDVADCGASPAGPMFQIGSDGGMFATAAVLSGSGDVDANNVVQLTTANFLVLAPGERADVVVDFTDLADCVLYLTNHATERSPLGNGGDAADMPALDVQGGQIATSGMRSHVLRFEVAAATPAALLPAERPCSAPGGAPDNLYKALATIGVAQPPQIPFPMPDAFGEECKSRGDLRQYVIREFPNTPINARDALGSLPGRRGWSAITFQSDVNKSKTSGLLWAGSRTPQFPSRTNRHSGFTVWLIADSFLSGHGGSERSDGGQTV